MARVSDRRAGAVLAAVSLANLLVAALHFGLAASAPLLRERLSLTDVSLGALLAAPPAGLMLGTFAWGVLADRRDERRVLTIAFIAAACSILLAAVAAHEQLVLALGAALLASGLCGSAAHSAGGRAIAASFPPRRHGTVLAIRHTSIPIGGLLGGLLVPAGIAVGGIALPLMVLGASTLMAALVLWLTLEGVSVPATSSQTIAHTPSPSPLRSARLWLLGGGCASLAFTQLGLASFLTIYLVDEAHMTISRAALVFGAAQLAGAAGRIVLGLWSDRMPDRIVVLVGVAGLALAGMLVAATSGVARVDTVVLTGALALTTMWNGVAVAVAATMAAHDRLGATLGMQTTMNAAACTIAPLIIGWVLHASGWQVVEWILVVMLAVSFVSLVALRRLRRAGQDPLAVGVA